MFFNNSTYPVGLDISDLSLKLVQLKKIRDRIKIQAMAKLNLPPGLIVAGEIKQKEELIKAIKKIMADPGFGKVSSEEITACLPESKTFIKLIEVEKTPNQLPDIIESEIEKHVPMAINEIYYDYQVIEDLAEKQLVLIGAAPQNIVNQYTEMFDQAKLSPLALEIEPISICRSLLVEEQPGLNLKLGRFSSKKLSPVSRVQNKNYAIIDIGANHTAMTFYSINTILFTISMPISGEHITDSIAKALEIEKDQAEKAKIICGLDPDKAQGIISNILEDIIKELINRIKDALAFYENNYKERGPINQIILCGGGANIKNIAQTISQAININVIAGDPLVNLAEIKDNISKIINEKYSLESNKLKIKIPNKNLTLSQDSSLSYATAIGLALRGIFIDEL